jgi:hypothetical protein
MKKYTRPTIEIVELESMQNMADVNPMAATTVEGTDGTVTTVYNLALVNSTSYNA